MKALNSLNELLENVKNKEKSFVLLYKKGNDTSECAFTNINNSLNNQDISIFTIDVLNVRDVHSNYGITTVPTLLIFENGEFTNFIKGCQDVEFYKGLFNSALYRAKAKAEGKEPKQVTVYSTPTCTWCNTLKSWLRKNSIPFTDVDISRNESAAKELVNRTGQHGVPQTEINGRWVIGFDEKRLKELLEI